MCYSFTDCILCGTVTYPCNTSTPSNQPDPPSKIICPSCGTVSKGIYRKNTTWFGICFIPLIPCYSSSAHIACNNCKFLFTDININNKCNKCDAITPSSLPHCANCGSKL